MLNLIITNRKYPVRITKRRYNNTQRERGTLCILHKKGIVRRFIERGETEATFYFAFEHDFVSAYDSFITQTPCRYSLQALEDTSLLRISWHDVQDLYQQSSKWDKIGRILNEQAYVERADREFSLLTKSPQREI